MKVAVLLENGFEELEAMGPIALLRRGGLDVDMIGVNNRNLGSFHTDVENSFRLAEKLPKEILKVSESGISDPILIGRLRKAGYKGFLIGETFMKEVNPGDALASFKSAIPC